MKIPVVLEWQGKNIGWQAYARLPQGLEIVVKRAHNLNSARRRLAQAVIKTGIKKPEFDEDLRIPKHLAAGVTRVRALREAKERSVQAANEASREVAQRLLTEMNLSEREVAEWIGMSHTHLSSLLSAGTVETGEFSKQEAPARSRSTRTSSI